MVNSINFIEKSTLEKGTKMSNKDLAYFLHIELWVFLFSLLSLLIYKMMMGRVNTTGLLLDKTTGEFSPARLQLLLVTLSGSVAYLFPTDATKDPLQVSQMLVGLIGGSNLYYIGAKTLSKYQGSLLTLFREMRRQVK